MLFERGHGARNCGWRHGEFARRSGKSATLSDFYEGLDGVKTVQFIMPLYVIITSKIRLFISYIIIIMFFSTGVETARSGVKASGNATYKAETPPIK